jgi:hypothetical protein
MIRNRIKVVVFMPERKVRMKKTSFFSILIIAVIILAGCNLPGAAVQAPTPDQAFLNTAVAQTVDAVNAAATAAAAAMSSPTVPPATNTPEPPPTATTTPGPTITPPPPPTATIVPGVPMIAANIDTNCRFGPGPDYGAIGFLLISDGQVPVKGRNSSNSWWYIVNPKYPTANCWAWGGSTKVTGEVNTLPVVSVPSITVGVGASPSDYTGACPVTITFSGSFTSNGPVTYTYRFETDGGFNSAQGTVSSTGAGTVGSTATNTYSADTTDKVRVHLLSPQNIYSGWKSFKVDCP